MFAERSPMETLTAFGICFVLGAVSVVVIQAWTKHVINREAEKHGKAQA